MWIAPWISDRHSLAALVESCLGTGMTEPMLVVSDIRIETRGIEIPGSWHLVPALAPLSLHTRTALAMKLGRHGDYLGFLPPGFLPRSHGWDRILGHAAGRWSIVQAQDLRHGGRHPLTGQVALTGAVALGGELVHALGNPVPEGLELKDAALIWLNLGRELGLLAFRHDVVVEAGTPQRTIREAPSQGMASHDRAPLFRWLNDEARPLVRQLRETIGRDRRRLAGSEDLLAGTAGAGPALMNVRSERSMSHAAVAL